MTQVSSPHRLHYPMQVSMGNKSQVNPDSYHTTRSLCDKNDRVSSLGNKTFRLTPQVSYTHTQNFLDDTAGLLHQYRTFRMIPRVSYTHTELSDNTAGLLHPYRTFRIIPRVSYTHIELSGSYHGSLTRNTCDFPFKWP